MSKPRDTYKYRLKVGKKVVHIGVTTDLEHREREHQKDWAGSKIYRIGHRTTREAARSWEREQINRVKIEPKELRKVSPATRSKVYKYKDRVFEVLK